jgi:5-formyltetrahydrofolate cyclo-ligase
MKSETKIIENLRSNLRKQRRNLTEIQQLVAADRLLDNVLRLPRFRSSNHIACYLPNDGEIDPTPVIQAVLNQGKHCYLPVLAKINGNQLWFAEVGVDTPMTANRFGIAEPSVPDRELVRAARLDLVFLPLVGFDALGHRVGMGGGYYDRSLQLLRYRRYWMKPYVVGLAHEIQKVDRISPNPWDVPLQQIVTDQKIYDCVFRARPE